MPVRFTAEWERDASLRLRQGDKTALDAYAEHGRILGASREEALDILRQRYVARRLAGEDALLMAYERADCRELSRMIRDDLIHLGLVDDGRSVQLSEGERASAGDVIVCRENDARVETDPGHTLTNGDSFKVESVCKNGAWVRRVLESIRQTGAMRLADMLFSAANPNYAPSPTWGTRSPGTRAWAAPSAPARRWSPAASRGSGCMSR